MDGSEQTRVPELGVTPEPIKSSLEPVNSLEPIKSPEPFHLSGNLAHFEVCEILGKGSMGTVYRAKDKVLQRDVALKLLHNTMAGDVLLDEARLACQLNHANIVTIYEVIEVNDNHCIVMEWVDGQPLDELIPAQGLELITALKYACQIVDGLACAHQHQIIHHDIKPQNIMLTDRGQSGGQLKILDFGIAGILREQSSQLEDASTGSGGTPSFMAPEQVLGQALDQRADIFSLGIVLYIMLCGKRPFLANSADGLAKAITHGEMIPINQHLPELPLGLVALLNKMLATDKLDRWQTTQALSEALHAVYQQLTEEKNWWQRRHWLSKAAIVLPFVLLLGWSSKEVLFPPSTDELIERQLAEATTIALLPFDNISGDPLLQLFGDGLAVALSSDLAVVGRERNNSWVIPSATISKMNDPSVQKISDKYGVDLVLTGSVQHLGSTRLLVLNLLNGKDGRQLKSVEISVDANKLFQGNIEIRRQAVALLGWSVPPSLLAKFNAQRPQLDGAYKEYLQGQGYLYRNEQPDNISKAQQAFSQAIAIDPRYQLAYVGLAEAHLQRFIQTKDSQWLDQMGHTIAAFRLINPAHSLLDYLTGELLGRKGQYNEAVPLYQRSIEQNPRHIKSYFGLALAFDKLDDPSKAEATYQQAIAMAPNNVLGVNSLGAFYFFRGDYQQAIDQFKRLAQMAPNNHFAFFNIAAAFYAMGQIEAAIENTEIGLLINPSGNGYSNLATLFFYQKNYHKAVTAYEKALEFDDNYYIIWGNLGDAYRLANNVKSRDAYQKAADLAQTAFDLNPKDSQAMISLAFYLANLGQSALALNYVQQLGPQNNGNEHFMAALTADVLGETDWVLEHLQQALDKNYSAEEIRDTPMLNKVRQDARFERLFEGNLDGNK